MNREVKIKSDVKLSSSKSIGQAEDKGEAVKEVRVRSKAIKPKRAIAFSYKATDDKNVLAIIEIVRNGISYSDFDKIADDTPFSLAEWGNYLQLSKRTMQRNQKEQKSFQPIQSERIVELSMLYQYGVEVFGDKDNFNT